MKAKIIRRIIFLLCIIFTSYGYGQITIDYPTDVTLECTADLTPSVNNPLLGFPDVTTSCLVGQPDISFSDNEDQLTECGKTGVLMRFWTVTDPCGGFQTLLQRITIEDKTPPEVNCLPEVTVECDASLNPAENPDLGFPSIVDCSEGDDLTISFTDKNEGQGICDNLPEIISRTWTVTDACGNSSTCQQTIRVGVEDLIVFCTTADFIQECNGLDGSRFAAESWDLSHINQLRNCSSSQCGGIEVISDFDFGRLSGTCGITGSLEVNYLIKDGCGNTKFKTAMFTLRDTTPPESFCNPIDFEVSCEGDETAASRVESWHSENLALIETCLFDNCGMVTVSSDFNASNFNINDLNFDCNDEVGFPVNYTLTDECGNTTVKTAALKIVDNGRPTFENVPRDTSIGAMESLAVETPRVIDNCSANLTSEFAEERIDNTIDEGYQLIRTWSATDDCGNVGTATQRIMVLDPILSLACTSANAEVVNNQIVISDLLAPNEIVKVFASDQRIVYNCFRNCGEVQTTRTLAEDTYDVDIQFYTATWQLICSYNISITIGAVDNGGGDGSGNNDPCTATECETEAPVLSNIPADRTANSNAVPSPSNPTATDNCDTDVDITFNEIRTDGTDADNYVLTRTWTATDDCGNIATATQIISVESDSNSGGNDDPCTASECETISPIIGNVPTDVTVNSSNVPAPAQPIATDNCDTDVTLILSETITESIDADNFVLTRTWMATDDCGNTATAQQEIRVVTPDNSSGDGGSGGTGGGNTDNLCGEVVITTGDNTFNFSNLNAPNKIIKIFDLDFNVLLECNENCGSEHSFVWEIEGTYFADVQLYSAEWEFICETRETVMLSAEGNSGGGDPGNGNTSGICADIQVTLDASSVNISNLNAPNKIIKLFDENYNVLEECSGECSEPFSFSLPPIGNYFVDVQLYTAEWAFICEVQNPISIDTNDGNGSGGGNNGGNSGNECTAIEIITTQTAIVFNNINRANKIVKIFDENFNVIFSCFTDCEEQIIAPIPALGLYQIDIQLYSDDWILLCEDRREMTITENSPADECQVIDCGDNSGGNNGNTGSTENPTCEDILIETTSSQINLSNLNAANVILKVFNESFDILFQCFATCEESVSVRNLIAGNYQVNINFYDENWVEICERIAPISIGENLTSTNVPNPANLSKNSRLSTKPISSKQGFTLYPNPANNEVMIDLKAFKGQKIQLNIYNPFSQQLWQQTINKASGNINRINLSDLENGVYILTVESEGQAPIAKKLLITR